MNESGAKYKFYLPEREKVTAKSWFTNGVWLELVLDFVKIILYERRREGIANKEQQGKSDR